MRKESQNKLGKLPEAGDLLHHPDPDPDRGDPPDLTRADELARRKRRALGLRRSKNKIAAQSRKKNR